MANRVAAWQNPSIVGAVDSWWKDQFPYNEANATTVAAYKAVPTVTIMDLYDLYYSWADNWRYRSFRLNFDQFAKCLMAARVMDIGGGIWRQAVDWEPTADQIRRVTGA